MMNANKTKRTVKELRRPIQVELQNALTEIFTKYPEALISSTLQDMMTREVAWVADELYHNGRVLTNAERWGVDGARK